MEKYFDGVTVPRIKKVSFSPEWRDGKPVRLPNAEESERSPRLIKVVRLESYEDTLNNLDSAGSTQQQAVLELRGAQTPGSLREQYMLRYMLDVETRGSQSLLNIKAFTDPTAYKLKVKIPGQRRKSRGQRRSAGNLQLADGLTVQHIAAPQTFAAEFERDSEKRLGSRAA